MQPQRPTLRPLRERFCIPEPTYPNSPGSRTNAIPVFRSSRNNLNQNSRPFIMNTHTRRGPTFQPFTTRINSMRPTVRSNNLPNPSLKHTQIECRYCSNSFEPELIAEHVNNCDMSKMTCDKCGDRILLDIYEIHYEECSMQTDMGSHNALNMRLGDEMDDDSIEMEEAHITMPSMFISDNEMTYERLLLLDEGVKKKGMSIQELKQFPVQLYVKSLDGEGRCVICLCDYETGEYVRKLGCKHKFHKGCIDKWLDANITCPTCKKYLR